MGGNGEESAQRQLSPQRGDGVGGAAEFSVRGGAPRVGAVRKATRRGFARGVLRSEDGGGGRNRTEARRRRFMAAQWHGRGKGVGGPKWKGGRAVSCGHAARGDAGGAGPCAAVARGPLLLRARPTRTVTFLIYSEEFQKEAT
jgi:hypothetical protein